MDQKIIQFAQQIPILDHIPGYLNIMSLDSEYVEVNHATLSLIGLKSKKAVLGMKYTEMPCKASESGEIFEREDREVIQTGKEMTVISYQEFEYGNWSVLYGTKKPLIMDGTTIGTIQHFTDITNHGLIDLGKFLFNDIKCQSSMRRRQFSYQVGLHRNSLDLTVREHECLFLLLRGKTTRFIAEFFGISTRTVETHINSLKLKFNVENKSELIECALTSGFMQAIPESLFKQKIPNQ